MTRPASATLRARATRIGCTVAMLVEQERLGNAWCKPCRRWRNVTLWFGRNAARPSGRQDVCCECRAEKLREWKARRAA